MQLGVVVHRVVLAWGEGVEVMKKSHKNQPRDLVGCQEQRRAIHCQVKYQTQTSLIMHKDMTRRIEVNRIGEVEEDDQLEGTLVAGIHMLTRRDTVAIMGTKIKP